MPHSSEGRRFYPPVQHKKASPPRRRAEPIEITAHVGWTPMSGRGRGGRMYIAEETDKGPVEVRRIASSRHVSPSSPVGRTEDAILQKLERMKASSRAYIGETPLVPQGYSSLVRETSIASNATLPPQVLSPRDITRHHSPIRSSRNIHTAASSSPVEALRKRIDFPAVDSRATSPIREPLPLIKDPTPAIRESITLPLPPLPLPRGITSMVPYTQPVPVVSAAVQEEVIQSMMDKLSSHVSKEIAMGLYSLKGEINAGAGAKAGVEGLGDLEPPSSIEVPAMVPPPPPMPYASRHRGTPRSTPVKTPADTGAPVWGYDEQEFQPADAAVVIPISRPVTPTPIRDMESPLVSPTRKVIPEPLFPHHLSTHESLPQPHPSQPQPSQPPQSPRPLLQAQLSPPRPKSFASSCLISPTKPWRFIESPNRPGGTPPVSPKEDAQVLREQQCHDVVTYRGEVEHGEMVRGEVVRDLHFGEPHENGNHGLGTVPKTVLETHEVHDACEADGEVWHEHKESTLQVRRLRERVIELEEQLRQTAQQQILANPEPERPELFERQQFLSTPCVTELFRDEPVEIELSEHHTSLASAQLVQAVPELFEQQHAFANERMRPELFESQSEALAVRPAEMVVRDISQEQELDATTTECHVALPVLSEFVAELATFPTPVHLFEQGEEIRNRFLEVTLLTSEMQLQRCLALANLYEHEQQVYTTREVLPLNEHSQTLSSALPPIMLYEIHNYIAPLYPEAAPVPMHHSTEVQTEVTCILCEGAHDVRHCPLAAGPGLGNATSQTDPRCVHCDDIDASHDCPQAPPVVSTGTCQTETSLGTVASQTDVFCGLCGNTGHIEKGCPHAAQSAPCGTQTEAFCSFCKESGHTAHSCPLAQVSTCSLCGVTGHETQHCHLSRAVLATNGVQTDVLCDVCKIIGHDAHLCPVAPVFVHGGCQTDVECTLCKRIGHEANTCHLRSVLVACDTQTEPFCSLCGSSGHEALLCHMLQRPSPILSSGPTQTDPICRHCGGTEHAEHFCPVVPPPPVIVSGGCQTEFVPCTFCKGTDHEVYACPFELPTCSLCGHAGHDKHTCQMSRPVLVGRDTQTDTTQCVSKDLQVDLHPTCALCHTAHGEHACPLAEQDHTPAVVHVEEWSQTDSPIRRAGSTQWVPYDWSTSVGCQAEQWESVQASTSPFDLCLDVPSNASVCMQTTAVVPLTTAIQTDSMHTMQAMSQTNGISLEDRCTLAVVTTSNTGVQCELVSKPLETVQPEPTLFISPTKGDVEPVALSVHEANPMLMSSVVPPVSLHEHTTELTSPWEHKAPVLTVHSAMMTSPRKQDASEPVKMQPVSLHEHTFMLSSPMKHRDRVPASELVAHSAMTNKVPEPEPEPEPEPIERLLTLDARLAVPEQRFVSEVPVQQYRNEKVQTTVESTSTADVRRILDLSTSTDAADSNQGDILKVPPSQAGSRRPKSQYYRQLQHEAAKTKSPAMSPPQVMAEVQVSTATLRMRSIEEELAALKELTRKRVHDSGKLSPPVPKFNLSSPRAQFKSRISPTRDSVHTSPAQPRYVSPMRMRLMGSPRGKISPPLDSPMRTVAIGSPRVNPLHSPRLHSLHSPVRTSLVPDVHDVAPLASTSVPMPLTASIIAPVPVLIAAPVVMESPPVPAAAPVQLQAGLQSPAKNWDVAPVSVLTALPEVSLQSPVRTKDLTPSLPLSLPVPLPVPHESALYSPTRSREASTSAKIGQMFSPPRSRDAFGVNEQGLQSPLRNRLSLSDEQEMKSPRRPEGLDVRSGSVVSDASDGRWGKWWAARKIENDAALQKMEALSLETSRLQMKMEAMATGSRLSSPVRYKEANTWDIDLSRGVKISESGKEAIAVAAGMAGHILIGKIGVDLALPVGISSWAVTVTLGRASDRDVLVGLTAKGAGFGPTYFYRGDGCKIADNGDGIQKGSRHSIPLPKGASDISCSVDHSLRTVTFTVQGQPKEAFTIPPHITTTLYPMVVLGTTSDAASLRF